MAADDKPKVLYRLNEGQYLKLEAQFGDPHVGDKTTAEQAAFQVGVQAVLKRLRTGFVV